MADISKLVLEVDSSGVRNATNDLDRFGKSSKTTEKSVGGFSKSLIASAGAIAGVSVALKGMVNFAKASISAFSDFEMVKTNLQVVTGSAEEAEKQFRELKELAAKTPFEVEGLANASVMLQQSGVQASELTDTLRMLGDVAGGNNEKFNRIAQNFAQIQSVGKASAMDMRQFAMAGLPVYDLMKKMGIQGQATAEQVTQMFKEMTSEGGTFFNGMGLQSGTLNGKVSTLKDTWKDFLATFAETSGLANLTKSVIDKLTNSIQGLNDQIEKTKRGSELAQGFLEGGYEAKVEYYNELIKQITESLGYNSTQLEQLFGKEELTIDERNYVNAVKELDALKEQFATQEKMIELEKDRVEENKRLVELQQKQAQEFQSIFAGIESEYNAMIESRLTPLQKVQKRINELDKLKSQKTTEMQTIGGIQRPILVDAFDDEQKKVIQALIDMLAEERNALRDNTKATEENTEIEETLTSLTDIIGERSISNAKQFISGSDVGAFVEGAETGGAKGGLINLFEKSLYNVLGAIEGIDLILSPITTMLREFTPIIKTLLYPLLAITKGLQVLGKVIYNVLNFLTFGLFDKMSDAYDDLLRVTTEQVDKTRDLNSNMGNLKNTLTNLMDAIDKQEEYYFRKHLEIGAENRYSVNDMILTPQGTFSTHPKDTIIATKNPQELVSGGTVNVTINNTQASDVEVTTRGDNNNLIIDISRRVADDFARGMNGWDDAVNYREIQNAGRRLS